MRTCIYALMSCGAVMLGLWTIQDPATGQAGGTDTVVVDGGILTDGNGGTPVRDVQVLIQGNRISKIGKKGDTTPLGAQVIRADGKFILPGLWDSQLNFYSYQGERDPRPHAVDRA